MSKRSDDHELILDAAQELADVIIINKAAIIAALPRRELDGLTNALHLVNRALLKARGHTFPRKPEAAPGPKDAVIASLVEALKGLLAIADEPAIGRHFKLADTLDNSGSPYQSQQLADALEMARAALAKAEVADV